MGSVTKLYCLGVVEKSLVTDLAMLCGCVDHKTGGYKHTKLMQVSLALDDVDDLELSFNSLR